MTRPDDVFVRLERAEATLAALEEALRDRRSQLVVQRNVVAGLPQALTTEEPVPQPPTPVPLSERIVTIYVMFTVGIVLGIPLVFLVFKLFGVF